jgi:hypothetical protein
MDIASWRHTLTVGGFAGSIAFAMFDHNRRGRVVPDILTTALRGLREMTV